MRLAGKGYHKVRPASKGHFNHMAIIITLLNPKKQPSRLAQSEAMKQRPSKCEATMQRLPESEASMLRPPTSEAKRKGLSENEAQIQMRPNAITVIESSDKICISIMIEKQNTEDKAKELHGNFFIQGLV